MVSTQLTKTAAARRRAANPYSLGSALKNGGPIVWLSCLIMGLGNLCAGQFVKGLLFLAIEAAVIAYMVIPSGGLSWISLLPSLGDRPTQEVWNDNLGVYEYIIGDNSQQILLYAVASIVILVALAVVWIASVRSGYMALSFRRSGKRVPSIVDDRGKLSPFLRKGHSTAFPPRPFENA